jgi:3-deoxy-D-manno-octulosonic-acid transferase
MRRAFQNINPSVCILMELEVWPNFVKIAGERNVPVIVANGRLSKKSFERYNRFHFFVKHIFSELSLVLAQTEIYAERFRQIGCRENNIKVSGSLKYDTAEITERTKGTNELKEQLKLDDQPLLVAGGTGNDEEAIILQVYKRLIQDSQLSNLRLAVVPRKPERFDEVAFLIERMGFPLIRYSKIKEGSQTQIPENAVILGDTMGDLRKFYSLATIIFTGRSLVPMGGSDMMEAAALGKCTIFGPHTFNFEQTVEELIKGQGAMRVNDADDLYETVKECLLEPDMAQRLAENGKDVIRQNQGATEFTVQEIAKLLD